MIVTKDILRGEERDLLIYQGNHFIINTSKPAWGDFNHWVCRYSRTGADCGAR